MTFIGRDSGPDNSSPLSFNNQPEHRGPELQLSTSTRSVCISVRAMTLNSPSGSYDSTTSCVGYLDEWGVSAPPGP